MNNPNILAICQAKKNVWKRYPFAIMSLIVGVQAYLFIQEGDSFGASLFTVFTAFYIILTFFYWRILYTADESGITMRYGIKKIKIQWDDVTDYYDYP